MFRVKNNKERVMVVEDSFNPDDADYIFTSRVYDK